MRPVPIRTALLSALIAVLALTSVTLAMARGTTRIGGQVVVLCSGQGFVQIEMDERGNPVGQTHICPDMALAALAHLGQAPVLVHRPNGRVITDVPVRRVSAPAEHVGERRARGPPRTV